MGTLNTFDGFVVVESPNVFNTCNIAKEPNNHNNYYYKVVTICIDCNWSNSCRCLRCYAHMICKTSTKKTLFNHAHPKLKMLKISKSADSICIYLVSFGFHAVFKLVPTRLHSNKNWRKPRVVNLWNPVCPAYDVYENTEDQLFKQSLAGV